MAEKLGKEEAENDYREKVVAAVSVGNYYGAESARSLTDYLQIVRAGRIYSPKMI
jgi:3-hydroxy-3-methylglutaryl CoA synthase